MKLYRKMILFFLFNSVLFAVMFYVNHPILWAVWAIGNILFWSYLTYTIYILEKGIDLLPDSILFRNTLKKVSGRIGKQLVNKVEELEKNIQGKYSAKVMDKQSKINSLQSQINPHFLYNTLECIRSEAIFQECGSIANMAKSLASFFRYSISRKENMVTILDELGNIKNYFLIQNYRFEDKFDFIVNVEEDDNSVYSYLIPKMTIQPIVENSIFHGLETKAGECYVKIDFQTTEDKIVITVSDNGVGMPEETLKELRHKMEYGGDGSGLIRAEHNNGVALYNVNQRIKLTFGPEYGLQIYSTPGAGTDMEIIIPKINDKTKMQL